MQEHFPQEHAKDVEMGAAVDKVLGASPVITQDLKAAFDAYHVYHLHHLEHEEKVAAHPFMMLYLFTFRLRACFVLG